jgi:SAM-dependent methyltransferase
VRFSALRRNWERLGRRDPYWAVLTDPSKQDGGWDVGEFFASGVAEIDDVLQRAGQLGFTAARGRALDFGCGVGRLTQAMATHFARCDGVDISESMLQAARQQNRWPERCHYHLNPASDLALFHDASFDFVYSTLVLQHMEPRYSTGYIREFLRVLAPHGLLVFQVPSQRSTEEPPVGATQTPVRGPLARDAFRARLTIDSQSLAAAPGQQVALTVTVENHSPRTWPALADAKGDSQITVGNHWLYEDGDVRQRDDGRCPLPFDVPPGARATVMLVVTAPSDDGTYLLELDLVQENVAWFAERGSSTLRVPLVVGTGRGAVRPARPVLTTEPPFRMRHPRAYQVMRATGVRDVYWAWRRAVDRVKSARDGVIVAVRERLRPSRVINRVTAWWRRGPFSPRMEMYCVPRAEVLSLVTAAGGTVVTVDDEWTPGFQSCRYWVGKSFMV